MCRTNFKRRWVDDCEGGIEMSQSFRIDIFGTDTVALPVSDVRQLVVADTTTCSRVTTTRRRRYDLARAEALLARHVLSTSTVVLLYSTVT